jgi:hypothetical protein
MMDARGCRKCGVSWLSAALNAVGLCQGWRDKTAQIQLLAVKVHDPLNARSEGFYEIRVSSEGRNSHEG